MGQSWVVVAIVVGIGLALVLFFWSRKLDAAAKKPGPKGAAGGKSAKGEAKSAGEKAAAKGGDAADAKSATPSPAPAKAPGGAKSAEKAGAEKGTPGPAFERAKTVREPAVQRAMAVESLVEPDDDDDITIVTLTPRMDLLAAALPDASGIAGGADDDDDDDGGVDEDDVIVPKQTAVPIIYDEEAAEDEPTRATAVILVAAVGQTDRGQKRKINEDRYLALDDHNLYVVADGMGGHAGGEVASQLAVDTIAQAFTEQRFEGTPYDNVPRRGSELALAIQMANRAIYERARREPRLNGMGTTIVSARFTPGKERVYIGHVGDSRCYRFRAGQLTQITTDHTMGAVGMTGPFADHLSRAVGIAPAVKVDLVIAKPRHDDVFLLCSDGLSKMVKDDVIGEILGAHSDPSEAIRALVQRANERGGRDNITVILVVVKDPAGFARYVQAQQKKKRAGGGELKLPSPQPVRPRREKPLDADDRDRRRHGRRRPQRRKRRRRRS
ncbi:MAG: PP2C family serine/threonine-protein phosphatase [Polyangiaceae bacterium]